jgi:uncharacterized protein YjbJ (UPF0337 family)
VPETTIREAKMAGQEGMGEKMKGAAKEAMGKVTGDENKEREGEHQQMKAQKSQEADRAEDKAAEKRRDEAAHEDSQRTLGDR